MSKIFRLFPQNKKILPLIFGVGIILIFLPLQSAQAVVEKLIGGGCENVTGVWNVIACWIKNLFDIVAGIVMYLPFLWPITSLVFIIGFIGLFVSFIFYAFACLLLNWVVSPLFIPLSLTQTTNQIINAGWTFTSGLVNLFFILVLVFIAIASILRLETYGLKRLLPKFLIVVLLINFSLVICGAIVDIANIVQRSFLGSIQDIGNSFLNIFFKVFKDIFNTFYLGISSNDPINFLKAVDQVLERFFSFSGLITTLVQIFSAILFGFFAGFVILLYVLLFMIRIIALWFLAIMAPIAWFCWILPFTQRFFRMWWNYFLQWAFVGAIAGFFLRLSGEVISQMDKLAPAVLTVPSGNNWSDILQAILSPISTVLTGLFAFGAVIAFMIIGFILSLKLSGGGTEMVLQWGERGLRAAGAFAATAAARRFAGPTAERLATGLGAAAKRASRFEESAKGIAKPFATALRWATRGPAMVLGPPLIEYAAKMRKVAKPPHWDKMTLFEKEQHIDLQGIEGDKLVLASYMAAEGDYQKTSPEFRDKIRSIRDKFAQAKDPRYKKEVGALLDVEPQTITEKVKLDFELTGLPKEEAEKKKKEIKEKIGKIVLEFEAVGIKIDREQAAGILHAQGLKPDDIPKVDENALKSLQFQLAMREMTSAHLQKLRDSFKAETVRAVLEEGRGLNTINEAEYQKIVAKNPRLVRWAFESPAGREMLNWSTRFRPPPPSEPPHRPPDIPPGWVPRPGGFWAPPSKPAGPSGEERLRRRREAAGL